MPKPEIQRTDPRLNHKGQIHAPLVRSISGTSLVDAEEGVLRNVLLCESMQPKGYAGTFEVWSEEEDNWYPIPVITPVEFIDKLVELSANFREKGQKARFGHPAMCEQEAGMHCGWIRNIRREGNGAVGDIYLADFADLSPKGTLKSYILKAAQEDPEALMMSIVFSPGEYYFIENGQEVEYDYSFEHDARIMALPEEERALYETVNAWHYTDFVSEGANTNNLFRNVKGEVMNAALVTDFLDGNPEIFDMLTKSPEIVEGFLKKYEAHKARTASSKKQMSKPKKTWLQRSADWLAEKMNGAGTVQVRNIDATTADGVGITILTDADVPAAGDQVQVTETGEAPPAGVHTIAGGDLDGYQITTDETGTITEVTEPVSDDPEEEESSETVSEEAIRKMVADEVAKAIAPLQESLKSLNANIKSISEKPLAKRVIEVKKQTGEEGKEKPLSKFEQDLKSAIHGV
jgi:hypothetical protein